ncbi:hypothetical protein [Hirschia baltica]|uniref:Uncharacterized protein n=1 Tax=Hirschia baltica (strain ATCC 49814 / DSM 5838 / IFAM 1418) TaxID=582402 RepID=C6XR34_HIRBI|nr:hypothetical protein [Hirschia baltica]ACT60565.1 hypothetical protein Hbal_2894 [Hirschia baltica ATCC 49814]
MNEQNDYDGKAIAAINKRLSNDTLKDGRVDAILPSTSRETLPGISIESREVRNG